MELYWNGGGLKLVMSFIFSMAKCILEMKVRVMWLCKLLSYKDSIYWLVGKIGLVLKW